MRILSIVANRIVIVAATSRNLAPAALVHTMQPFRVDVFRLHRILVDRFINRSELAFPVRSAAGHRQST